MVFHRSCAKLVLLFVPALADIHWVSKESGRGCTKPSLTHLFDGADTKLRMPTVTSLAERGVKDVLRKNAYFNDGLLSSHSTGSETACVGKVPENIHFIWMGTPLSTQHARNALKFATLNPSWTVFLWLDRQMNAAARHVLKAVADRLRVKIIQQEAHKFVNRDLMCKNDNYGGKSDLLRIEAVYSEGGIYSDFDVTWHHPLAAYAEAFRWPFSTFSKNSGAGCPIFGAERHSPFLEFLIRAVRENCRSFHKCSVMYEAGNGVHSAALLAYGSSDITLIDKDDIAQPAVGADAKNRVSSDAHEGNLVGGWWQEFASGKSHPDVGFCEDRRLDTFLV
eukprot:TRINITY_DN10944_c0_g1_i1.p1 TRINITY_DN10944_c0_g1~~TRINITY_DN10944_c0_g1_i1.p1  ORF type:complete len:336 (-),score=35.37 TRINITY_DN10944_c0_g1_i1:279-1286(-)